MNPQDDEIPLSIDDTILILSRAAGSNGNHLPEITLVGGQALNFWADRYFGSRDDFVSGDIDLLGGTTEALRCARAWDAKINVANMDSAMGSPNTAVVLIDRGVGNPSLRVDFLGNIIGPSVRDVLNARFEVVAKQGFSFHVMHPLHIMESRIGNAFYLGRKDEAAMHRLELSFSVTKAHIQDVMAQDARSGLKLVERVVDVVLSERGKMSWYSGHDPMAAIPDPTEMPEVTPLFSEKRWPQIVSEVAAKRTAYAGTMQQIEQFNRQRLQKEAAAGLEQSSSLPKRVTSMLMESRGDQEIAVQDKDVGRHTGGLHHAREAVLATSQAITKLQGHIECVRKDKTFPVDVPQNPADRDTRTQRVLEVLDERVRKMVVQLEKTCAVIADLPEAERLPTLLSLRKRMSDVHGHLGTLPSPQGSGTIADKAVQYIKSIAAATSAAYDALPKGSPPGAATSVRVKKPGP